MGWELVRGRAGSGLLAFLSWSEHGQRRRFLCGPSQGPRGTGTRAGGKDETEQLLALVSPWLRGPSRTFPYPPQKCSCVLTPLLCVWQACGTPWCMSFVTRRMFQFRFQFNFPFFFPLFFFFISLKLFFRLETSSPGNQLPPPRTVRLQASFLRQS